MRILKLGLCDDVYSQSQEYLAHHTMLIQRLSIVVPILATLMTVTSYLLAHPFSKSGGLFLLMSEQVLANGYAFPTTIPQIPGGIPFAYPPLGLYGIALLMDANVHWRTITTIYPACLTVVSTICMYHFILIIYDWRYATVTATIFATNPLVYHYHIAGGGAVRSLALVLSLLGLIVGVRVFRDAQRRFALVAGILLALTALTHLFYAMFFGITFLVLYTYFDRSLRGFIAGSSVAIVGLVLVTPWLLTVVQTHGVEVFLNASGTHTGLGPDVGTLGALTFSIPMRTELAALWTVMAMITFGLLLIEQRWFLPLWFATIAVGFGVWRFYGVIWSVMSGIFLIDYIPRLLPKHPHYRVILLVILLIFGGGASMLYAADYPGAYDQYTDAELASPISDDDIAALAALERQAERNDRVLNSHQMGDWIPFLTGTRTVSSSLGLEFSDPATATSYRQRGEALSDCQTAECVSNIVATMDHMPDYVYIQTPVSTSSFRKSNSMRIIHQNDAALVLTPMQSKNETASPQYEN
jgi:hypothetical protein